jgi:hypothetical protein
MTREEILGAVWTFDCPEHGLQGEKPLQAHPRNHRRERSAERAAGPEQAN